MKNLNEYIVESLEINDELINEGFLQKLKDGISDFVDNPKKYFDKAQVDINNYKDWFKNNKEYIDTIEKLNNEKELKKLYKFMKSNKDEFKDNWSGCGYGIKSDKDKKGYKNSHNIIKKYLYPNASFEQCWAIFDLMKAIDKAVYDAGGYSSKSSGSSSSSKSSDNDDTAMWGAIAAAI